MKLEILENRLTALRGELRKVGAFAWIQPMNDAFQSEYTPDFAQRLPWLTGFTGSAGTVIVTLDNAYLFVDGRYTLQAAQEVPDTHITIYNIADKTVRDFISSLTAEQTILFDAELHTSAEVNSWSDSLAKRLAHNNLIDAIWEDQPTSPAGSIKLMPDSVAGETRSAKIQRVIEQMKPEAEMCFVALPDAVNWLLNIRGDDVPYNPLLLCYALVKRSGAVTVFTYSAQCDALASLLADKQIEVLSVEALAKTFSAQQGKVQIDDRQVSYAIARMIDEADLIKAHDPVTQLKAVKNTTEIEGIKEAHRKDGRAVSAFITWFNALSESEVISEMEASDKLEAFRKMDADYLQPSFTTISGSAGNGAIVHYRVTEESNLPIAHGDMYLVDSGGQYPYGTTDITRTLVRGEPSEEMKLRYTQVLKGHIGLVQAVFPEGTTGAELDILARQHLWADAVDYAHGTGHGVGHYLCVHEGPQGISRRSTRVSLEEGMVLSNEPGYYKTDAFGIRIENLIVVVAKGKMEDGRKRLGFETLTLAPLEKKLVNWDALCVAEKEWWDQYHSEVQKNVI